MASCFLPFAEVDPQCEILTPSCRGGRCGKVFVVELVKSRAVEQSGGQMQIRNLLVAGLMVIVLMGAAGLAQAEDVRMFVRHEVTDYAVWREAFDAFAPTQKKMGVTFKAVYQSTDDPNDVTVIHDFHSLEKAKTFAASPELKAAMEKAGVKGAPQIWYTTRSAK
jgi:ABC-type sugar transport system substrate-binding protein